MAIDWIKMRVNLIDDPAVLVIANATGIDEFGVIGRLHKLWSWADQQTTDGNAPGVTNVAARAWLDRYLSCTGFADALVAVGWLEIDETGMRLPNFDRHNGQSGKQRAVTAKRVRNHRSQCNGATVTQHVTDGNTGVVTEALPDLKRTDQVGNSKTSQPSKNGRRANKSSKSGSGQGKGIDPEDLNDPEKILAYVQRRGIDIGIYENQVRSLGAVLESNANGNAPPAYFVSLVDKATTGAWTVGDEFHEPAKRWLLDCKKSKQPKVVPIADEVDPAEAVVTALTAASGGSTT